ncbi:UUP1 family membrane protein, partial [Oleiphilus sp. HI0080]
MNSRIQISVFICILIILGVGAIAYKNQVLSFPLSTSEDQEVWSVEIKLSFESTEDVVTVALNAADINPYRRTRITEHSGPFQRKKTRLENNYETVSFEGEMPPGKQELLIRYETWFLSHNDYEHAKPEPLAEPEFLDEEKQSVKDITARLNRLSSPKEKALALLDMMHTSEPSIRRLLSEKARLKERLALAQNILALAGVHTKTAQGLMLRDRKRNTPIQQFLLVHEDGAWLTIDAQEEY